MRTAKHQRSVSSTRSAVTGREDEDIRTLKYAALLGLSSPCWIVALCLAGVATGVRPRLPRHDFHANSTNESERITAMLQPPLERGARPRGARSTPCDLVKYVFRFS